MSCTLQVWLTTGDQKHLLELQPPLPAKTSPPSSDLTITVDQSQTFQVVKGYGAALTNSSAYLIHRCPRKDEILDALFSNSGIGVSYIRLPMGCTDFQGVPPYTYDDVESPSLDFELREFSIRRDRAFIIPVLKGILERNPDLKIIASPWTAPSWLKEKRTLFGSQLKSFPKYLKAYAKYFVKFIEAYAREGIDIDAITVQNEPEYVDSTYPTMKMTVAEQTDFIKKYLGPEFEANHVKTQIVIYDHNWDDYGYPICVLSDPDANHFISGTAFHGYAGNPDTPFKVHEEFPDKDIYFTECSGGDWDVIFGSVLTWNMSNLFIGQSRVWARTVLLWNLALDPDHGPSVDVGGAKNCRGVLTIHPDGQFDKEPEFYTIGHFSKFVKQGAVRIESSTHPLEELESVAFKNLDESIIIVVLNKSEDEKKTFCVKIDDKVFQFPSLSERSVVTLVYRSDESPTGLTG